MVQINYTAITTTATDFFKCLNRHNVSCGNSGKKDFYLANQKLNATTQE